MRTNTFIRSAQVHSALICPACGDYTTLHNCSDQEVREAVELQSEVGEFEEPFTLSELGVF